VRLLLDTHVVLWQLAASRRLGPRTEEAIGAADELLFSVVSFAEIGVKAAIGKLTVDAGISDEVLRLGLRLVGLTPDHGLAVARLPLHHRDPFDRLLVAQACSERLTLVTADRRIAQYDVPVLDALT
jgi:PIN domain nuclease of toxin-antitoxin system